MSSDEPSKPSGRRRRGVAVVAGMALILVVATLASAVLFREDLAQAVLRDRLTELGLKAPRFRVEQITIGFLGGEAGTCGALPAIQNAVNDALHHIGAAPVEMPTTPEKVWQAIQDYQTYPMTSDPVRNTVVLPDVAGLPAWEEHIRGTVIEVTTVKSVRPNRIVRSSDLCTGAE